MLASSLIALVLAFLLVGTTPIGTGMGVHQFDLVHPLFPHTHIVNGRVLTHQQLEPAGSGPRLGTSGSDRKRGPAIGASAGAEPVESGVGWCPTLMCQVTSVMAGEQWTWATGEPRLPQGRIEAPPDPPPTPATV